VQAAIPMEDAGLFIALFEKDNFIGGKTKTIQLDGRAWSMAAITDIQAKNNTIESFTTEYSTTILFDNLEQDFYAIKNGKISLPQEFGLVDIISSLHYFLIQIWVDFTLDKPDDYAKLELEEYAQPAKDWFQGKFLFYMAQSFWTLSYGQINKTPILYFMKFSNSKQLVNYIIKAINPSAHTGSRVLFFQELFQSMAATLEGQVNLSTDITDASYGEENPLSHSLPMMETHSNLHVVPPLQLLPLFMEQFAYLHHLQLQRNSKLPV